MTSPTIAVVGSANIDLTTFTHRFPKAGETIFADKFDLGFGGKGANQAAAARLCGADVFMVSRVGSDLFGPATIDNFKKLGIDATHVKQVEGLSSGVAPIFVEPNGQNRILVVKGANDALKEADIDAAAEMLKGADFIVLQFEIPLETVYYTIRFARKHGIRCIVNPAPGQSVEMHALDGVDYFVPNESEAETIAGVAVRSVEDAKRCAEKLLSGGIRRVIITLGANGSLLAGQGISEHVPPFAVESTDSTGAGDAFIGSFAVFLAEGVPEREAVRRANLYAGLSTISIGTQKSFYSRARFDAEWAARHHCS
jgi:ribokinase